MLRSDVLDLAHAHRIRQQRLAALATNEIGKLWRFVGAVNAPGSWAAAAPRALVLLTAAQAEAARGAQQYVTTAISMQVFAPNPSGTVVESAFSGIAADGRPLDTLLGYPAFEVSAFVDGGMSAQQAVAIGQRHLKRIVATEVVDAARVATGVAIVNERQAAGYLRAPDSVTCSRCVILASRWYAWNEGFPRHPFCACGAIPSAARTKPRSAKAMFDAMSAAELAQSGWSRADIKAIDDGHDIDQAIDAAHDLRYVSIAGARPKTTLRTTARRGDAGRRPGVAVRMTPEALYAESHRNGWSRDETIRHLMRFGFIN